MRVAVVTEQLLAPVPGGTGRYTAEVVRELARHAPGGGEITGWVGAHREIGPARIPGARGPRRLPLGRRGLALAWERGYGPSPRGADLVYAPTVLAPPRRRRPLVATVPDLVPWTHPNTLTPRGVRFHRRIVARAVAEADAVVVYTRAVAAELLDVLAVGPAKVHVVPAGVRPELVAAPPDAALRRQRLGLPDRYVVTVATLEPRKGLDVAVDAVAATPAAARVPLVVVGRTGWGGVDIADLRERRGLDERDVRTVGHLSDRDVAAVLTGATAALVPSRAEGFGLPLLEALAAGVPAVCSDAPALVEVAAGAALVVPVGDAEALAAAVSRVAADDVLRAELVERGRARAGVFSWDAAADRLWGLFASLLH